MFGNLPMLMLCIKVRDVNNYRPIAVTSCFMKMLEKIIFKYTFNYITFHNFLSAHQSGFRPRDSTVNQLLDIYIILYVAIRMQVRIYGLYSVMLVKRLTVFGTRVFYINYKHMVLKVSYLTGSRLICLT